LRKRQEWVFPVVDDCQRKHLGVFASVLAFSKPARSTSDFERDGDALKLAQAAAEHVRAEVGGGQLPDLRSCRFKGRVFADRGDPTAKAVLEDQLYHLDRVHNPASNRRVIVEKLQKDWVGENVDRLGEVLARYLCFVNRTIGFTPSIQAEHPIRSQLGESIAIVFRIAGPATVRLREAYKPGARLELRQLCSCGLGASCDGERQDDEKPPQRTGGGHEKEDS